MDLQGPAAKRAGIVLLLAICAGVGVAIAGIPTSVGSPRPIRLDAAVSSSSTTTTEPGATEPTLLCKLIAKDGPAQAEVARGPDGLLDYAVSPSRWMPLPSGTLEEVKLLKILVSAEALKANVALQSLAQSLSLL